MNKDAEKDLSLSHSIVNYLNAGCQGRFTYLNILSRLKSSLLNQQDLTRTKEEITRVTGWFNGLAKGAYLFSSNWDSPKTFDAQAAMRMLTELRDEALELSGRIAEIVLSDEKIADPENIKLLTAALGRVAYAKENYTRGFVELAKITKNEQWAKQNEELLKLCADDIKLTHDFLQDFDQILSSSESGVERRTALRYHSIKLPAILRAQAHDIRQLLNSYGPPLTYQDVGIPEDRAQQWQAAQASPAVAGYWEAYGIPPHEAETWLNAGIADYEEAGMWKLHGFDPATARTWSEKGFPPGIAFGWASAGHSPDQALEAIQKQASKEDGS